MNLRIALTAALGLAGGAATAATVSNNAIGYSLGNNGRTLVTMADLNMPSSTASLAITNGSGASVSLSGLAYRPMTRQLYGYSNQDDTVYLVDTMTGTASAQITVDMATDIDTLGFDFNNQLDAARIVTTSDRNYVFDPKTTPATLTRVTDLFYVPGDANEGVDPNIMANAYTNAVPMASTTLQYGFDAETDSLVTIGNNAGTLTTIGQLYYNGSLLDIGTDGGFDILSFAEGDNQAFALFNSAATAGSGLFSVDLTPDAMGRINVQLLGSTGMLLDGLAIAPAPAPVPVPATGLFLVAAIGGLGALRRRRT